MLIIYREKPTLGPFFVTIDESKKMGDFSRLEYPSVPLTPSEGIKWHTYPRCLPK